MTHKKIDDIVDTYLTEAKRKVDVMFKYNNGKIKITYVNPKGKKKPDWLKVGAELKSDMIGHLEMEYDLEVYNADGWKQKDGFIVEQASDLGKYDD